MKKAKPPRPAPSPPPSNPLYGAPLEMLVKGLLKLKPKKEAGG